MAAPIHQMNTRAQDPISSGQLLSTFQGIKKSQLATEAAADNVEAQKLRAAQAARVGARFDEETAARQASAASYVSSLASAGALYDADKEVSTLSALNASLNFAQTAGRGAGADYTDIGAMVARLETREQERKNPAAVNILKSFHEEYAAPNEGYALLAKRLGMETNTISHKSFTAMMKSRGAEGDIARAWWSDTATDTEKTNFGLLSGSPILGSGSTLRVVHRGDRRVLIGPHEVGAYDQRQSEEAKLRAEYSPEVANMVIANRRQVDDLNAMAVAKNALGQANERAKHPWASQATIDEMVLNPNGSRNMELVSATKLGSIESQRLASQLNTFGMYSTFITDASNKEQMTNARNASLQHTAWATKDPVGATVLTNLVLNGSVTDLATAENWRQSLTLTGVSPDVALRIPVVAANPVFKALAVDTDVIQSLARLDAAGGRDILAGDSSLAITMARDPSIQSKLAGLMQRKVTTLDEGGNLVETTRATRVPPGTITRVLGRVPKDTVELAGVLDQMTVAKEVADGVYTQAEVGTLAERYQATIKNTPVGTTEAEALANAGIVRHSEIITLIRSFSEEMTAGIQTFETGNQEEKKRFANIAKGSELPEPEEPIPGVPVPTGKQSDGTDAFSTQSGKSTFTSPTSIGFAPADSKAKAMTILDDPKKVQLINSFFAGMPTSELVIRKAEFTKMVGGDKLMQQVAADVANVYIEQRTAFEGVIDGARALDFLDPKRLAEDTPTPGVEQTPELTKSGGSRHKFAGGSSYTVTKDDVGADVHTFSMAGNPAIFKAASKDELFVQVEHDLRTRAPQMVDQIKAGQAIGLLDAGEADFFTGQLRDVRGKMPDKLAGFMAGQTDGESQAAVRDLSWAFGPKKAGLIISSRGGMTIPEAMAASVKDENLVAATRDTLAAVKGARDSMRLGTVLHGLTQEQLEQIYLTDRSLVTREQTRIAPVAGEIPDTYSINRNAPISAFDARIRELTFNAARYSLYTNKETK